jgi:hypothetical protein
MASNLLIAHNIPHHNILITSDQIISSQKHLFAMTEIENWLNHKAYGKVAVKVERIKLIGAYTSNGEYFGVGAPLFSMTMESVVDGRYHFIDQRYIRADHYQSVRAAVKHAAKKQELNVYVER